MKVRIQATERVQYDKTVEMTKQEFNELKKMADEADGKRLPISADEFWLDTMNDIVDSQGLEDITVTKVR